MKLEADAGRAVRSVAHTSASARSTEHTGIWNHTVHLNGVEEVVMYWGDAVTQKL